MPTKDDLLDPAYLRQLVLGDEVKAPRAWIGPQIEIAAQNISEPFIDRAAKAGDHHRHGNHERRAGDDPTQRGCRRAGCPLKMLDSQIEIKRAAGSFGQRHQQQACDCWHRRDPRGEQQAHRQIAEQRQPRDRRHEGGADANREKHKRQPQPRRSARIDCIADILERDGGGCACPL